ncbi:MAG: GEVED domain-containing protein [Bacteroidetes bacterium]|nr:GEVED domain-containing protein [Bacteroidota bacterium]
MKFNRLFFILLFTVLSLFHSKTGNTQNTTKSNNSIIPFDLITVIQNSNQNFKEVQHTFKNLWVQNTVKEEKSFNIFKNYRRKKAESKKLKWGEYLANHPFNNSANYSNIDTDNDEEEESDRPDLAMEQDFLMTVDPVTKVVPYEKLAIANKEVEKLFKKKAPISGITWQERGPNNVGGRTRALMFDPNDANKKKVWAGGVSGGLWFTSDITATTPTWNHVNDFWDNLIVTCIAFNPANTQEFYVGTGEGWFNADAQRGGGIWKTTDGGSTWTNITSTFPGAYNSGSHFDYVNKIVIKTDGTIFAATRGYYTNTGGIMRSTDGGANWTRVLTQYVSGTYRDWGADIEIASNGDLYASMGISSLGKVYKSINVNNGGSGTWTDLSANIVMGNAKRVELACAPSNSNIIYAVAQGGSGNQDVEWFKKSIDGGTTWTSLSIPVMVDGSGDYFTRSQAFYDLIIAVHPTNPSLVIVGGIDLHRSLDGGASWSGISHWYGGYSKPEVHADQHAIIFRPGYTNEMLFGNDGGIFYSTDAGNSASTPSFASKNTSYNVTQFYACATKNEVNSNYFLAGAQDNGSQKFTMPQIGSTTEASGGDGAFCHIDQLNSNIQITAYTNNNLYRSLDGGITFPSLTSDASGLFINPSDYDSQRKILYLTAANDQLKRISGMDVTPVTNTNLTISVGTVQVSAIKVSPYNDVVFLGIGNGRVYKYTNASTVSPVLTRIDNGTTPITTAGWVSCVEVGANDNNILVTYSNYGVTSVWETNDGGANWYSKEGNLPDMPVRWALYNPNNRNQVLLATEVGVWSTDNFGTGTNSVPVWGVSSANLAYTRCTMLKYRPADKMVVISTHGRGLFTSDIFVTTTVADFVADQNFSCTGSLTVNFKDASLKPGNSWAWDIDNNGTTDYTTQNITHTYSSPGLYTVKLTVNNGAATITKDIIVISSEPTVNTGCTLTSNSNLNNNADIGIHRFALGSIDNTTSHNDGYYQNYCCTQATALELNKTYNVTIVTGILNNESAKVYIDYNDNGIFESSEAVVSFTADKSGTHILSFTTPSSAVVLDKGLRLRVLSKFNAVPSTGCDISTYGQAEDYTVYVKSDASWTGTSSTSWTTPGNWNINSVPVSGAKIKIPTGATNYPVLTTNVNCRVLAIETGASVTINPTYSLTVSGNATNNAGINGLILKSDASGTASLIYSGTTVSGKVERYISAYSTAYNGWRFVSSPVNNAGIGNFAPGTGEDFYSYDETQNLCWQYQNTGSFVNGKGYLAAYKLGAAKSFSGTLNNSNQSFSNLSLTPAQQQGWQLLGNPFPSALIWNDGNWALSNISANAKVLNAGGTYTDVPPNGIIPAMQGFWVQVTNTTNSITIPAVSRTHSAVNLLNKSAVSERLILKAASIENSTYVESVIKTDNNASNGFDADFDAKFLAGLSGAPQFYSILPDYKLSTNTVLPIGKNEVSIPMGFVAGDANNYQLTVEGLNTFNSSAIILEDLKTNTFQNLVTNPIYSFTAISGDNINRFIVHFNYKGNNGNKNNSKVIYSYGSDIYVNSSETVMQISIYNPKGQLIYTVNKPEGIFYYSLNGKSKGCYLVKLITDKKVYSEKVFIK